MQWIHDYQLFLFDFDGLLVNTEEIHFLAYKQMCQARGIDLDWDFNRYCQAAHYDAHALKNQLYAQYKELYIQEPNWDVLYAEKKHLLSQLFKNGAVNLMPGVEEFLTILKKAQIPRCVVTHSPEDLVQLVRKQNPILDSIPLWVTRECYSKPKPDPECYQKAIELYAKPGDRIIGFEDTPRGINALLGTKIQPCLVCQANYPEISQFKQKGILHFSSLLEVIKNKL